MRKGARGIGAQFSVRRDTGRAVYAQIVDSLRDSIEQGALSPGERLASTRTLATDWGVSRNTVLQAFEALLAEGYLTARIGDGTYVADAPPGVAGVPSDKCASPRADMYPFRGLSRRGSNFVARAPQTPGEHLAPFTPDVPDLSEFPMRAWLRLMNEVSGGLTGEALAGVASAGYAPLRKAIAHHVTVTRGLRCTPAQVIVTTGSQQGLDLAIRMLLDRGDPVWMEDPGYFGTRAALSANGCNLQPIPVDDEGLDVASGIAGALAPRMICVSPARQYPTGAVLSPARRNALLEFAERCGAWIVEDDYDAETHYRGPAPPALGADARGARVLMVGTFSKTLVPSLRLGYLIVPQDMSEAFETARAVAQGHAPLLEQMVLAEMMHRGIYAAHVRRMRVLYRERQITLAEALRDTVGYTPPELETRSGMHLLLPLADGVSDVAVAAFLAAKRVVARPLSPYFLRGPKRQALLLGSAAFEPKRLTETAARLAAVLGSITADVR